MIRLWRTVSILCLGSFCIFSNLTCVTVLQAADASDRGNAAKLAQQIFQETGVAGGLVVHLGCGDGQLTAALRASDSFLVQGLDADASNVEAAREHIRTLGLYGNVSVEQFSRSRLPYIDKLVNLVVAEDLGNVSQDEIMRVLAPLGVAYVKQGGQWTKTVKPWPEEIDEWTHYLHDPSNNAVAHDSVIEPPRRYQWVAGPRYSRQHDHMSSVSAVVSAGGRLFYIFDEAPRASILTPPKWRLIARDAFNGTLLWKREIEVWHPHLWRLKSGPQLLDAPAGGGGRPGLRHAGHRCAAVGAGRGHRQDGPHLRRHEGHRGDPLLRRRTDPVGRRGRSAAAE